MQLFSRHYIDLLYMKNKNLGGDAGNLHQVQNYLCRSTVAL